MAGDVPEGVGHLDEWRPTPPFTEREPWVRLRADATLSRWVFQHILAPTGALHNPDHEHLQLAEIGFLWTDAALERRQRRIIGAAEIPNPRGHPVTKLRQRWALEELDVHGCDFVVTLDSVWCAEADDASFLALLEHELYHCGQAVDENGYPRFRQSDGQPIYEIRGHDVEEFVGVVERYGAGASSQEVERLVEAAQGEPTVNRADIARICGTCRRAA